VTTLSTDPGTDFVVRPISPGEEPLLLSLPDPADRALTSRYAGFVRRG
jgi:hypothetical protein